MCPGNDGNTSHRTFEPLAPDCTASHPTIHQTSIITVRTGNLTSTFLCLILLPVLIFATVEPWMQTESY